MAASADVMPSKQRGSAFGDFETPCACVRSPPPLNRNENLVSRSQIKNRLPREDAARLRANPYYEPEVRKVFGPGCIYVQVEKKYSRGRIAHSKKSLVLGSPDDLDDARAAKTPKCLTLPSLGS